MSEKNGNNSNKFLKATESRSPIGMTAVVTSTNTGLKPNTIERGRGPVTMTPVQPKTAVPVNTKTTQKSKEG